MKKQKATESITQDYGKVEKWEYVLIIILIIWGAIGGVYALIKIL